MARLRRVELFDPEEIAFVHVMNRVVRRAFLFGDDPLSGKNFDHRKGWLEAELQRAAAYFGIDLIAFSLMSNHFHLVLRSRPDVVAIWDDTEVARRWLMLCPLDKKKGVKSNKEPSEAALNTIRNDPERLREIRRRLSDISWWMRLVCQRIAQRANAEDDEQGKFWESRYRSVRLLDEAAILACAAYVDLNPIRAAMAETIEESAFTSAQRRVNALAAGLSENGAAGSIPSPVANTSQLADACLAPVQLEETASDAATPQAVEQLQCGGLGAPAGRCSNKGFTNMTSFDYLQLLDWTARNIVPGKRGSTPADAPMLLERLGIQPEAWCELVSNFGAFFNLVAGKPQQVDAYRSRHQQQQFRLKKETRQLLAA